jgi:hypothetical protein
MTSLIFNISSGPVSLFITFTRLPIYDKVCAKVKNLNLNYRFTGYTISLSITLSVLKATKLKLTL